MKHISKGSKQLSERIHVTLEAYLRGFFMLITDMDAVMLYQVIIVSLQAHPNEGLLSLCLEKLDLIDKSVVMKRQDKQYMVLKAIGKMVDVSRKHIEQYEMMLLDNLNSPDESLKQLTMDVLFKTVNAHNLELITEKVTEYIS